MEAPPDWGLRLPRPSQSRVGVLLANPYLVARTGSELATQEIAEVLVSRGYRVAIFALELGPFAAEVERSPHVRVLTLGDKDEILNFAPDVIHTHDWSSLIAIQALGVHAPAVFGALGTLPAVANPPPLGIGQKMHWWGISHAVVDNVLAVPGFSECPHALIPNWFDDRELERPLSRGRQNVTRAVVVSNHFPEDVMDRLRATGASLGFSVAHVGLPNNPRDVTPDFLQGFDCVVTLGRTAITTMALGLPVLVADVHGADGWIRPSTLDRLARHNYSGRAMRVEPTVDLLLSWFSNPPATWELLELQEHAWNHHRLTIAVDALEKLLLDAISSGFDPTFGPWADLLAGYIIQRAADRKELLARAEALQAADLRDQRARAQLAEWESELTLRAEALAAADDRERALRSAVAHLGTGP